MQVAILAALIRLETAATRRDNVMGDPCALIEAKAELAAAAKSARNVIVKYGPPEINRVKSARGRAASQNDKDAVQSLDTLLGILGEKVAEYRRAEEDSP